MSEQTDRELLELAAKAAGIMLLRSRMGDPMCNDYLLVERKPDGRAIGWNPLSNDGDALRLGAKLNMFDEMAQFQWILSVLQEKFKDPAEAIRRAIVETAAELGKALP